MLQLSKDEIQSKQFKRKVTRMLYIIVGTGTLTGTFRHYITASLHVPSAWPAVVNVTTLVIALTEPDVVFIPSIILSKIYANSMMVLVNNRLSLANSDFTIGDLPTMQISSLHAATVMTASDESQDQTDSKALAAEICSGKGSKFAHTASVHLVQSAGNC